MSTQQVDLEQFRSGVNRLVAFRRDLEYLPEDQRSNRIDQAMIASLRSIGCTLNRAIGFEQQEGWLAEVKGPFKDPLSRFSQISSVFATTGQWLSIAEDTVPALFEQHEQLDVEQPFGFHPRGSSS